MVAWGGTGDVDEGGRGVVVSAAVAREKEGEGGEGVVVGKVVVGKVVVGKVVVVAAAGEAAEAVLSSDVSVLHHEREGRGS